MIKIRKSKDGQFYFTVHAKNGAVLVTSETYTRKSNCKKGIKNLKNVIKMMDYEPVHMRNLIPLDTAIKNLIKYKKS